MKTIFLLFAITIIFSACQKNTSSTTVSTDVYINTSSGSSWSYLQTDLLNSNPPSNYTVTSTSNDTTINSRKYHVYSYSYGGSEYLGVTGHDYYQYDSIPVSGGINIERLYLKDNASIGTNWSQDFSLTIPGVPLPVPLKVNNKIVEKGITRTENGTSYSNVIHVSTTLSSSLIPSSAFSSSIDSYYAPKYGLIENTSVIQLNYLGLVENVNVETQLMSSNLK
ncbi:MAG: hypothetical protein KGM16_08705 [Bacteroidota bacterium]|nr:hypothetical protein [Bacteroidota bacterium]